MQWRGVSQEQNTSRALHLLLTCVRHGRITARLSGKRIQSQWHARTHYLDKLGIRVEGLPNATEARRAWEVRRDHWVDMSTGYRRTFWPTAALP